MEAPIFIFYLLKFFLVLAIFSAFGKLTLPQKAGAPYYNAFFNTFLSAIIFAVLLALWKTKFYTVMAGFVIWLILWLINRTKGHDFLLNSKRFYFSISLRYLYRIGALILALSGIFFWAYWARIQSAPFPFVLPEGIALAPNDIHIYALRSYYLGLTGQENYFGIYNAFDANFHGPKPYHYLELWLNVGVGHFLEGLNVLNLSLITGPLFQAISLLGILALWERYIMVRWHHILLSFALLWLAGFYFFYDKIGLPAFSLPIMTYRFKMVVYYPFLLGYALSFVYEELKKGILLLIGLSIATIVAAPALFGGLLLFAASYWIFFDNKSFPIKNLVLSGFLVFGFIGVFYFLAGSSSAGTTFELGQSEAANAFQVGQLIKKVPQYVLYGLIHVSLLYVPYFLLLYLFRHYIFIQLAKNKYFFMLNFCLIISGAFVWAVLHDFAQSSQLFYNVAIPLLNVMSILLLILIAKEYRISVFNLKGLMVIGVVFLIIVSQVYLVGKTHFKERGKQNYSVSYLLQIDSLVQSGKLSSIGAALKGPEDYRSEYSKMAAGYTLGYYLQYMENGYATVSLSDFEIPINPKEQRNNLKDIQSGAFFQFVERQKVIGTFKSIEQSQLDFLQKNNINFLVVSANGVLPDMLGPYVELELRDSISGERFVLVGGTSFGQEAE